MIAAARITIVIAGIVAVLLIALIIAGRIGGERPSEYKLEDKRNRTAIVCPIAGTCWTYERN
jgi:hypothetical protein